jgi:hypothetical protein
MSVSPTATFPPPTESQIGPEKVREAPTQTFPPSGNASAGEGERPQSAPVPPADPQDEVKLQWDTSDRIEVYQFVNQQGSLIVQVPSEQMLSIAQEISAALAREATPKEPVINEGGKANGR